MVRVNREEDFLRQGQGIRVTMQVEMRPCTEDRPLMVVGKLTTMQVVKLQWLSTLRHYTLTGEETGEMKEIRIENKK